ncbi:MAG: hypothetical protein J6C97_00705 [Clostridia bacterium]|nr:hypothetical protein [Clostridia bacterium]
MKLVEFIKNNDDWEKVLSSSPYYIQIKRHDGYIIFNYNQLFSDFNLEIVRECRGCILKEDGFKPVCVAFYKFGNYKESYVPDIDWASATTQEKVDGTIIKVWHDNGWHVSTNGSINASYCDIHKSNLTNQTCPYSTYGELFEIAKNNAGLNFDSLNKNYTYIFELVGPYNKVVVSYDKTEIYHIGTRDLTTMQELDIDIGVKKPKVYPLNDLQACVESAKNLPFNAEGYVVVDKFYNRVKIKSPSYVKFHHLKHNSSPNTSHIIELLKENELAEFLTYFPEYSNWVQKIKDKLEQVVFYMQQELNKIKEMQFSSKKDFAFYVTKLNNYAFYFAWYHNKNITPKAWLYSLPTKNLVQILGEEESE